MAQRAGRRVARITVVLARPSGREPTRLPAPEVPICVEPPARLLGLLGGRYVSAGTQPRRLSSRSLPRGRLRWHRVVGPYAEPPSSLKAVAFGPEEAIS
jgi:hypothetical protein